MRYKIYTILFILFAAFAFPSIVMSCEDIRFQLTNKQIVQIQNAWGGALESHREKLVLNFNKYKPSNYKGFSQYKSSNWLKKWNHNKEKMDCGWVKYGRSMDQDYEEMLSILNSMTDLNTISIKMQSYLKNGRKSDASYISKKLSEISRLSSKYVQFKPKPNELNH